MNTKSSFKSKIQSTLIALALATVIFGYPIGYLSSQRTEVFTVQDKYVKQVPNGKIFKDRYLVETEDGQVYENTDSVLFLKWNSANVQAQLKKGHTYKVKIAGWRIPMISSMQNIISVEEESVSAVTQEVTPVK